MEEGHGQDLVRQGRSGFVSSTCCWLYQRTQRPDGAIRSQPLASRGPEEAQMTSQGVQSPGVLAVLDAELCGYGEVVIPSRPVLYRAEALAPSAETRTKRNWLRYGSNSLLVWLQ